MMNKSSNAYRKALDKTDKAIAAAIRNLHGAILYSEGVQQKDILQIEGMIGEFGMYRVNLVGITPDEPPPEDEPARGDPNFPFESVGEYVDNKGKKDASKSKTE